MITKYRVFCLVIEIGSFTKAAKILGYSQSAVSQIVKSLERELGTILVNRGKDGIRLTSDGEQFLPYLQAIQVAEN
ncbi:LysR family transcriptional regulator [Enterococcus sp.]|uniref:LysR family transcriptional regulator n=1 Tax=Enterococcus sp. TaxID=35783 RepID=UPI0029099998|nr:LysR family transcriptional regulator [Enterococcus sp.]MDU5333768.1 LysR family transcriptional regulator [Enterococcus sp.]